MPLASALAEIVREVDDVRVDSVRFDASRGELSVSALYSGFGDFERLRRAAEAAAWCWKTAARVRARRAYQLNLR
ncbi:MAG: hypothetical protein JKP95_02730 [Oceanicaulis sp.]|nr:hypothetical protein [Oceanicaulis sp.]